MEEDKAGDSTDGKSFFKAKKKSKITEHAVFDGPVNKEDYNMNFPMTGKCLIFNQRDFDKNTGIEESRSGTDTDAERLHNQFEEFGFETKLFVNLTVEEVLNELVKAGKDDYSDCACLVCCILSHGDNGILYARDGPYLTDQVYSPFRGDVCSSLLGKPKVFFIQACQGTKLDSGANIMCRESTDAMDDVQVYKIPTHADFLIVYSTVPGFYSWRNPTEGSWFIQALCDVLEEYGKKKDLQEILTIVNHKVAYEFTSYVPKNRSQHLMKQVPCVTSTLTRKIKF